MFEDDVIPRWEQDAEAKSKIRTSIYEEMYGKPYKYTVSSSDTQRSASGTMNMLDDLPEPAERELKPYVPPTDLGELPDILDAPMGEE